MKQIRFWEKPRKPKFRIWPFGFGSVRVFINRNRTEIRFPHIPITYDLSSIPTGFPQDWLPFPRNSRNICAHTHGFSADSMRYPSSPLVCTSLWPMPTRYVALHPCTTQHCADVPFTLNCTLAQARDRGLGTDGQTDGRGATHVWPPRGGPHKNSQISIAPCIQS